MSTWCIGIDLGGTFIKFVLLDRKLKPTRTIQLPTPQEGDSRPVVAQMVAGAKQVMKKHGLTRKQVAGVGIGSPGPIHIAKGLVIAMPNIPGMDNCPLRDQVTEGLGLPAVLENDANAAAYGEYICGAGRNTGDMIMFTLGTGVGGGIIVDGRVLHGRHDAGAELGHVIVVPDGELCGCGQRGCLEQYASATFMAKRTVQELTKSRQKTLLRQIFREKGALTSRDINQARKQGDRFAERMWDQCAYYLALGCVDMCRIFDPDKIVLAGGMTNAGNDLMEPLMKHFNQQHWTMIKPLTTISIARLGNDAGAIGAAGVAWQAFAKA